MNIIRLETVTNGFIYVNLDNIAYVVPQEGHTATIHFTGGQAMIVKRTPSEFEKRLQVSFEVKE